MTIPPSRSERDGDIEGLLHRIAARDRGAFEALYGATAGRILAIVLRLVRDRASAEDVLQNVFVKVWNRSDRFDARRGDGMAWLATMARNEGIDWLRKHRRDAPSAHDPDELTAGAPSPLAAADRAASRSALTECLTALPEVQRSCIRLAFLEGLTHGDLAARLAAPLGTVKARIRRGMARLKRCLEGTVDGNGGADEA
ncbi:sigma-70 family RNA polymerase sigma factor [Halomonas denitrificans]|nr:sigma-70 family RNA polymerase sigma factor [Halomonas denitrificans]